MIKMVVPLMTDSSLQRTVRRSSIPTTRAGFVPAAIGVVTPVVHKNHEAGEPTSSVFRGELMAVPVADARLWEVFGKPVGALDVTLDDLKICGLLGVHFLGGRSWRN
jgi:hypothetical protein